MAQLCARACRLAGEEGAPLATGCVLVKRAQGAAPGLSAPARLDGVAEALSVADAGIADGDTLIVLPPTKRDEQRALRAARRGEEARGWARTTPVEAHAPAGGPAGPGSGSGVGTFHSTYRGVTATARRRIPRSPGPREIRAACEAACAAAGLPPPKPQRGTQASPQRERRTGMNYSTDALEMLLRHTQGLMSSADRPPPALVNDNEREERDEDEDEEAEADEPLPEADATLVEQLTAMGFGEHAAARALLVQRNRLEQAIEWLCEHGEDEGVNNPVDEAFRREIADRRRPGGVRRRVARGGGLGPQSGGDVRLGGMLPPPVAEHADEAALGRLVDMGFARASAANALRVGGNDPDVAVELILGAGGDFTEHHLRRAQERRRRAEESQAQGRVAAPVADAELARALSDALRRTLTQAREGHDSAPARQQLQELRETLETAMRGRQLAHTAARDGQQVGEPRDSIEREGESMLSRWRGEGQRDSGGEGQGDAGDEGQGDAGGEGQGDAGGEGQGDASGEADSQGSGDSVSVLSESTQAIQGLVGMLEESLLSFDGADEMEDEVEEASDEDEDQEVDYDDEGDYDEDEEAFEPLLEDDVGTFADAPGGDDGGEEDDNRIGAS